MSAAALPDELWRRILEVGVSRSTLRHRDLCCLSITCRRLRRLSHDNALWFVLIASDFPPQANPDPHPSHHHNNDNDNPSSKSLYKIRFERDRARKLAAHRRAVLRIESQIHVHSKNIVAMKRRFAEETQKLKFAVADVSNLQATRQAAEALNVWQPEVVRGRHKQLVEQCTVPFEYRKNSVEMEIKLCRQQIAGLDKAIKDEEHRLGVVKEQLASINYHPLRDEKMITKVNESYPKKKKLKKQFIGGLWDDGKGDKVAREG